DPSNDRLRRQVALVDAAQISTIHSFCLWIVRRWFSDAGIDPSAVVLDAEQARSLRREVLERVFADRYASQHDPDDPLGAAAMLNDRSASAAYAESGEDAQSAQSVGRRFVALVDDYGLGNDDIIRDAVVGLAAFAESLPDPDGWLTEAAQSLADQPELVVAASLAGLRDELLWQRTHAEELGVAIELDDPAADDYAERIRRYCCALDEWAADLPPRDAAASEVLAACDVLRDRIAAFDLIGARAKSIPKDADDDARAARKRTQTAFGRVKKMFDDRVARRFGLFSSAEWLDGVKRTAPYVAALVEVVQAFRTVYTAAKRKQAVLDFSDLERLAYGLISEPGGCDRASEIGRSLQKRFAYVLVDEFQDINPLQEAIIRLVSRELDPDRPDNLFVVGDVKQSIYRFRLAEPTIFTDRMERFAAGKSDESGESGVSGGAVISLQENFRSRPTVLDAVNILFRRLMRRELGGVAYDERAELRPGRKIDDTIWHTVELHLLEKSFSGKANARSAVGDTEDGADGSDDVDTSSDPYDRGVSRTLTPDRWASIDREAYLIGSRIKAFTADESFATDGRKLRYRDVVVLVRAAKVNAERIATMLSAQGIPSYADVGGSLFGALEVRDVLAALDILDNLQQDIPLAAVLRSGIMGERLSEDELVEIRCLDRGAAFHEVVRRYAEEGGDAALKERLSRLFARIRRYRDAVRRRPLAEVLQRIYDETGYLAHVCGLPNGEQRRANLLKLHERARQFGTFRTQGLHRFLRFIEALEKEGDTVGSAPALGESEDVVRVMSIHKSKGLEFPVVFVAGLGTRLNLGDRSGRIIFERRAKIGLHVVDTERMIEYPSAVHQRASLAIDKVTREEELRVLYVALTRARDKLVLVAATNGAESLVGAASVARRGPTILDTVTATTPLDWILPALAGAPDGAVQWPDAVAPSRPVFDVRVHDVAEMTDWSIDASSDVDCAKMRQVIARCAPLPTEEPMAPGDPEVEGVLKRVDYAYPWLASASVRAVWGASEFKGAFDYTQDPDERPTRSVDADAVTLSAVSTSDAAARPSDEVWSSSAGAAATEPRTTAPPARVSRSGPAERGIAVHRVLQHLRFGEAVDSNGVARDLQRLLGEGVMSEAELGLVDVDAIVWFVGTPLASAIRSAGDAYRREFQYVASESPGYFDSSIGNLPDDTVLVRGIVDGILAVGESIEIIDFKTDAVAADSVDARTERYRPQMMLYARAMRRIWRRPVAAVHLVFMTPRMVVTMTELTGE
ncbi:MAG: UvrD-helicase domain-containing protein, partial [Planctomycetes bacterium]|nr:UvrD-helicase domain-containing protein [Planctomycetota bacterium]